MDMNPQICDSPVWNISKRNVFLTLLSLFQNLHRLTSIWYLDPILSSVMNQINNVFKIITIQLIAISQVHGWSQRRAISSWKQRRNFVESISFKRWGGGGNPCALSLNHWLSSTSSPLPLSETSLGLCSIFNAFLMTVTTIRTKTKKRW